MRLGPRPLGDRLRSIRGVVGRSGGPLRRASLVAIIVLSLGSNVYLVHEAVHYFGLASAIRLDPAGLNWYAVDRGKPLPRHPLVVFFGDSRAFMWSPPTLPGGYQIVNRGISNQTTEQMVLRLEADVVALHPDLVVLEAGVNDLKAIAELPGRRAQIVADCEVNLEAIVRRCVESGAQVVVVTVFDIGDVPLWLQPFWSREVAQSVQEVNRFLPRLVRAGVVLFDANRVLEGQGSAIQREYQLDYLHLTSAAYAALNQKLVPIVSALHD